MKTLRYKVMLRKEEDGTYTVIVPSLPGCLTLQANGGGCLSDGKGSH